MRTSQPLNRLLTSTLKGIFDATGLRPSFVLKHLPRVGPMSLQLPDGAIVKIDSSGEDWIPTQLFWNGWLGYEPEVVPIFYQLAKKARAVFDVGAHIGIFSILAGRANPNSRVVALEPLTRIYERLERNISLNGLTNVECQLAAAGDTEGDQEFYFPDEHAPVSSSLKSEWLLASMPAEKVQHVTVKVVKLDELATRLGLQHVDLIKLDTERTEHEALAGCVNILERDRPDIICEVWPDAKNVEQLEALLYPLNYSFYQLLPAGPQPRKRIAGSIDALNYLFTQRADFA